MARGGGEGRVKDSEIMIEILDRLAGSIEKPYCFEYQVSGNPVADVVVSGNVDCMSGRQIWEIKCVKTVRPEHSCKS